MTRKTFYGSYTPVVDQVQNLEFDLNRMSGCTVSWLVLQLVDGLVEMKP